MSRTLFLVLLLSSCLFADDPKKDKNRPTSDAPAEKSCRVPFVSKRMVPEQWYRDNGFGDPVKCEDPKTLPIKKATSIPIYWLIAGDSWTAKEAQDKLDAAKDWYSIYCIGLDFKPVLLTAPQKKALIKDINAHKDEKGDAYGDTINELFFRLWESNLHKAHPKFLLIMFVDEFTEVKYSNAVVNVSGNFSDIPLILITHADKDSKHIVTHELIHGLGKALGAKDGKPQSAGWVTSSNNSWNEGGCEKEMGNAARTNPSTPMNKDDKAPMDWASYWEYAKGAKTIK